MAKRSRARLEDLEWLREHLEATRQLAPKAAGRDRIARLEDWLVVMIDTRVAQITQPQTEHNRELVAAYRAELTMWEAERERIASDYPGDLAIFDAEHPKPDWTRFLTDQRRRVEAVKACACPMIIQHRPGCEAVPLLSLDDDNGCRGYLADCAQLGQCQCDRLGRE